MSLDCDLRIKTKAKYVSGTFEFQNVGLLRTFLEQLFNDDQGFVEFLTNEFKAGQGMATGFQKRYWDPACGLPYTLAGFLRGWVGDGRRNCSGGHTASSKGFLTQFLVFGYCKGPGLLWTPGQLQGSRLVP